MTKDKPSQWSTKEDRKERRETRGEESVMGLLGVETDPDPGSLHWHRLTLFEKGAFGALWASSVYVGVLAVQPEVMLFFVSIGLIASLVWLFFTLGSLAFTVGIPLGILHNTIKYDPEAVDDNERTESKQERAITNPICPDCGTSVDEGTRFCSECGTGLIPTECPDCEVHLDGDSNFCPKCGHELQSTTETITRVGQESDQTEA